MLRADAGARAASHGAPRAARVLRYTSLALIAFLLGSASVVLAASSGPMQIPTFHLADATVDTQLAKVDSAGNVQTRVNALPPVNVASMPAVGVSSLPPVQVSGTVNVQDPPSMNLLDVHEVAQYDGTLGTWTFDTSAYRQVRYSGQLNGASCQYANFEVLQKTASGSTIQLYKNFISGGCSGANSFFSELINLPGGTIIVKAQADPGSGWDLTVWGR